MSNWFDVDKSGLKNIQSEKDKFFIVSELVSNSFDEDIKVCEVNVWKDQTSSGKYFIKVEDDSPDGFRNLSHAYTMFASSYKKGNVKQRGRFNLGEKLALAMFDYAEIRSTRGAVIFDSNGRKKLSTKRNKGTTFKGLLKMKHKDFVSILEQSKKIICPDNVVLKVNNEIVDRKKLLSQFTCTLPTIIENVAGELRKAPKQTLVNVYPKSSDNGKVFELGIPVVDIDIDYDVDIQQKIPLNKDRDNVTPAFRKTLATEVLNHCHSLIKEDNIKAGWITDALEDADVNAVADVFTKRHGQDAVTVDLKDREAVSKAQASGVQVIYGSNYNSKVFDKLRKVREETDLFKPAGQYSQYASPKFQGGAVELPLDQYTDGMKKVAEYTKLIHQKITGVDCNVVLHDGSGANATYQKGGVPEIHYFWKVLGKNWFDLNNNRIDIDRLIIHEIGHHYCSNHLDENYYKALCIIGAKLTNLVRNGEV